MAQRHMGKSIWQFIMACLVIGTAVFFVGREFWMCDDSMLLQGYDAIPIFTKTKYIVDCLQLGQAPSWFPSWYCGSTVLQYYPPLFYLLTTPIEYLAHNTNLTLKIFMYASYFTGGLGIWALCYKYINHWAGLLAASLYVLSPYFSISFFQAGGVAQMPIMAVAPWYMLTCMNFYNKPQKGSWFTIAILTLLMLTSHIMHGFMIALSVFFAMLIATFIDKKNIGTLLLWMLGTALGAGLLSFWWLVAVFPIEVHGVPTLQQSVAESVTASLAWYFPGLTEKIRTFFPELAINNIKTYFPAIPIFFASITIWIINKKEFDKNKTALRLLYVNTIFTAIFSFGYHLPLFEYLPFSSQLVPGRILTQTAIGTSVLSAYLIVKLFGSLRKRNFVKNVKIALLASLLLIALGSSYRYYPESIVKDANELSIYKAIQSRAQPFEKGRSVVLQYYYPMHAYYSYIYGLNTVQGWNIEGSSLAEYFRFVGPSFDYKKYEYLFKNLSDMNVQYYLLETYYDSGFGKLLVDNGFVKISEGSGLSIYFKEEQSYFYEQKRDCIVIGNNTKAFLIDHPWFVDGWYESPTEYSAEDLSRYDTIYFYEPNVKSRRENQYFESLLEDLANSGKSVFVELGRSYYSGSALLGVRNMLSPFAGTQYIKDEQRNIKKYYYTEMFDNRIYSLSGVDQILYTLTGSSEKISLPLVGTKSVGQGYVTFIGGPLTDYRYFIKGYYAGEDVSDTRLYERDEVIESVFKDLFTEPEQYQELSLPYFPVENVEWGVDEFDFSYAAQEDTEIMISVTYTARWHAYIGNQEIKMSSIDKMMSLVLPTGKHTVHMEYKPTGYVTIGAYMTCLSAGLVLIILLFFRRFIELFTGFGRFLAKWLEIPSVNKEPKDSISAQQEGSTQDGQNLL